MKGKIIDSAYNPGYDSWILKQSKYGTFDGYAEICDEDADIDNSIDGCRIAEFRADLRAYQEKARWMRQRAVGARIVYNCAIKDKNIEYIEDKALNALRNEVEMLEKQANDAKEYCKRMKAYEPMFIKNLLQERRETREMIDKRKN